ncbi:DMT family transporter [Pseudonocardia sp. CA-107938]|uniref:DMT family transporter n=1 Tax=Pseudonocardia sp. CA-107938 TaxID=3240021 RepID=UPI003D923772
MHVSFGRAGSGVPLLVLAGVLWGTGGLLGQALAAATGLSAVAVAGYRLALGGLLLCGPLLATGRIPRTRGAWSRVLAVGLLAAVFQSGYFVAVTTTSLSLATLVTIGVAPVAVLVIERLGRLRRIGARSVLGAAAAVTGLALLVGPAGDPGPGLLAAVAAGCAFAVVTVLSARPVDGLDAAATIGPAFVVGGALLLPVAALVPGGLGFAPSPQAVLLLALFAVVPTALAYTAYLGGLRTAPAGVGAVLSLLEPLTAAVLAAVVLGDRLGLLGWVGAAVLCCAVLVVAGDGYRTAPERTA